jgi:hypothetical protein
MFDAIVKSTTLPLFMLIVVVAEEVTAWRTLLVKPPPAWIVCQVESPRKNVVLLAVPDAKRAVFIVPLEMFAAFKLVTFEPVPLNAIICSH